MFYRWFGILCAAAIMVCGYGWAEEPAPEAEAVAREVSVDRDGDGANDGVDHYDSSDRIVRRGYDENSDGVMDRWESYDQNTGLPNVVASDTAGELN